MDIIRIIGFGIIGTGIASKIHAAAISGLKNGFIAAVFDSNASRAEIFAEIYNCKAFFNIEEFLASSEVNAVCICTPSGTHGELAIRAANAGKHLVIEKPIDICLENAEEIIKVCRSNSVKCSIISQHRFDAAYIKLKDAVEKGRLGKLYYGACNTKWYRDDNYYKASNWRGTWKWDGGGALINQSIHYIDLLLNIMGEVSEIYGSCATLGHDIEVEDIGIAALKFKNGALGMIHGTTLAYPGFSAELEICGENGTVIINDDVINYWSIKGYNGKEEILTTRNNACTGASSADAISFESHMRQYEDIVEAILSDREPLVNGEEGKRTLEFVLSIYEASRQGRILSF